MRWSRAKVDGLDVVVPDNWLYIHYYDALNTLFRIENALRTFVYVVLKHEHRSRWAEVSLATDEGSRSTIASAAKKRLNIVGYLGYNVGSPLAHLTSGELIGVILSDVEWPRFANYFPTKKEIVRLKLDEISNVRNALAHFRPIREDDVEVVSKTRNKFFQA
jgi:hypothetical protein